MTDCEESLVVRYGPDGPPTFLHNTAMSPESLRIYFDGLHQIDPLRAVSRSIRTPTVVTLQDLRDGAAADARYLFELYRTALIFDELSVMLPVPGGVAIAVCCERREVRFGAAERKIAQSLLPVVGALHHAHVERSFMYATTARREVLGSQLAYLILDAAGQRMDCSDQWRALEAGSGAVAHSLDQIGREERGLCAIDDRLMMRWESLPDDFAIAPGGRIATLVEQHSEGSAISLDATVNAFRRRWGLTDREVEIVSLILLGHPNVGIAERLGIGLGTVKNHRYRLYSKLDITTEREIFLLALKELLPIDAM